MREHGDVAGAVFTAAECTGSPIGETDRSPRVSMRRYCSLLCCDIECAARRIRPAIREVWPRAGSLAE